MYLCLHGSSPSFIYNDYEQCINCIVTSGFPYILIHTSLQANHLKKANNSIKLFFRTSSSFDDDIGDYSCMCQALYNIWLSTFLIQPTYIYIYIKILTILEKVIFNLNWYSVFYLKIFQTIEEKYIRYKNKGTAVLSNTLDRSQ